MNPIEYFVLDKHIFVEPSNSNFSTRSNDEMFECEIDVNGFFDNYSIDNLTLCINVTNACNLNCKYCFNKEKTGKLLEFETAKKMIGDFVRKFPLCEKYYIDLSGKGEPLLNLKTIYKIKEFCNELSNELKREFLVSFVSNGLLLTPHLAKDIQEHGILFGVSLDGNEFAHDSYRLDSQGNKTYQQILSNIKGIEHRDYVGCAVTLTDKVFSLKESLIELGELFNTISYKPVRDDVFGLNETNIEGWINSYEELVQFLVNELKNNDLKYIKILLNGDDYFGKFLKRCLLDERTVNRCDAGISRFALNDDGRVYACSPMSTEEYLEAEVDPAFNAQKQYFANSIYCNGCPFFYICGGECEVNRLHNNGDRIMCKYKQALIKLAMYLTLEIKEMNSSLREEIINFCIEKNNRFCIDKELDKFLQDNQNLSFVEGKKIYDNMTKKY